MLHPCPLKELKVLLKATKSPGNIASLSAFLSLKNRLVKRFQSISRRGKVPTKPEMAYAIRQKIYHRKDLSKCDRPKSKSVQQSSALLNNPEEIIISIIINIKNNNDNHNSDSNKNDRNNDTDSTDNNIKKGKINLS